MAQGTSDVTESRKVGDAELVTVGIDVSDRYSHLCVLGGDGEIVREERVRTTTAALTRALTPLQGARVVMEVGPRSPWLSRMFAELGHDVIVANPRQVRLIARSQRKTDRSDAEHLARLGRFDPALLFPIRHRSAMAQADLQVLRSREALVRGRTMFINHVRGAVKAWGAALPSCTAPAFHRAVREHIPEELGPALLPMLHQIEHLTGEIARPRLAATLRGAGVLQQIAAITSLTFVLTIEDPNRFPKNREVGRWCPGARVDRAPGGSRVAQAGPVRPRQRPQALGARYAESGAECEEACRRRGRDLAVLMLALWKSHEPLRRARAGRGGVAGSTRGARRPGGRWASEDARDAGTRATAAAAGPTEDEYRAAPTPWRADHHAPGPERPLDECE